MLICLSLQDASTMSLAACEGRVHLLCHKNPEYKLTSSSKIKYLHKNLHKITSQAKVLKTDNVVVEI